MIKKKITRDSIIMIISLLFVFIVISASIYLIGMLGSDLNRFLFTEDSTKEAEVIDFDFAAYEALGL